MQILGVILMVVGGIVALGGGIWFLVVAFRQHVLWGLGCFFVPFVSLIFLIMYWRNVWKPFVVQLGGAMVFVVGSVINAIASGAGPK
jgi:hypothetical protein